MVQKRGQATEVRKSDLQVMRLRSVSCPAISEPCVDNPFLRQGWLFKKGEKKTGELFGSSAYRRRYFALRERYLQYYKSSPEEEAVGTIDMSMVSPTHYVPHRSHSMIMIIAFLHELMPAQLVLPIWSGLVLQASDVRMSTDPSAPENAFEIVTKERVYILAPDDESSVVRPRAGPCKSRGRPSPGDSTMPCSDVGGSRSGWTLSRRRWTPSLTRAR